MDLVGDKILFLFYITCLCNYILIYRLIETANTFKKKKENRWDHEWRERKKVYFHLNLINLDKIPPTLCITLVHPYIKKKWGSPTPPPPLGNLGITSVCLPPLPNPK